MLTSGRCPVLLVDDNQATCTLVTAVLRNEFQVDVAKSGTEALEFLRANSYSAILLDLKMPGIDGYQVLEHLNVHQPEILPKVIVFTAAVTEKETERIRAYSVHGIVRKPFEIDALMAAVRRCSRGGRSGGP